MLTGEAVIADRDKVGRFPLLVVYLCLLGGTFTLTRVSSNLPALDLRWIGLLVALVVYLAWVATPTVRNGQRISMTGSRYMVTAWMGWMALASAWAPPMARVPDYLLDMFFLFAFLQLGWAIASRMTRTALTSLWTWQIWIGLIYFAGAMWVGPDVQGRYAAFGGGPNVFVRVMLLAAMGLLYNASVRNRLRPLLLMPIFLAGAVLSGSRGGLVAFGAVVLIAGFPLLQRLPRATWFVATGGLAALVWVAPSMASSILGQTVQQRFVQQTVEQRYDSGRSALVEQSLELFNQHFWIGSGLDGYFGSIGYRVGFEYPHNLVLATAAEGGIVGLALLLGAVLVLFRTARRERPMSTETLFYLMAGGFVFIASFFSGDYYDSRFVWFFLGVAAIEGRRGARARRERDSSSALVVGSRL